MDLSWLIAVLFLAVFLAVGLAVALMLGTVGAKRWAWGAAVTTPFMLYALPIAGVFISVNLLSGLAAFKGLNSRPLWNYWWFRFAALMAIWPVVAMVWSPAPFAGFRDFVYTLPYFFLVGAAYQFSGENAKAARRMLGWALILCSVEAVLVIIFRVSPAAEAGFITSRLAGIFISPNVLNGLFSGARNNIFDPAKSGGFFVNANVASAFLGCVVMLAWSLAASERWRLLKATAVLCWIAVFFTGSKAGAVCAILIPLGLFVLNAVRRGQVSIGAVAIGCFGIAGLIALAPTIWSLYEGTGFTHASTETLSVRKQIWLFAWKMFKQHPLLGLGNGGWEEKYPIYAMSQGIDPLYPAHNFVLILWSKAGLVAAFAGLAFATSFIVWCARVASLKTGADKASLATGLGAAFLWITVQASGENFGLIGEAHLTTLLAIAAGLVARESVRSKPSDG